MVDGRTMTSWPSLRPTSATRARLGRRGSRLDQGPRHQPQPRRSAGLQREGGRGAERGSPRRPARLTGERWRPCRPAAAGVPGPPVAAVAGRRPPAGSRARRGRRPASPSAARAGPAASRRRRRAARQGRPGPVPRPGRAAAVVEVGEEQHQDGGGPDRRRTAEVEPIEEAPVGSGPAEGEPQVLLADLADGSPGRPIVGRGSQVGLQRRVIGDPAGEVGLDAAGDVGELDHLADLECILARCRRAPAVADQVDHEDCREADHVPGSG